jgi:hypothetical protein
MFWGFLVWHSLCESWVLVARHVSVEPVGQKKFVGWILEPSCAGKRVLKARKLIQTCSRERICTCMWTWTLSMDMDTTRTMDMEKDTHVNNTHTEFFGRILTSRYAVFRILPVEENYFRLLTINRWLTFKLETARLCFLEFAHENGIKTITKCSGNTNSLDLSRRIHCSSPRSRNAIPLNGIIFQTKFWIWSRIIWL